VAFAHCLLEWVEVLRVAEPLYREHPLAARLHGQHEARANRHTVDDHRARTADPVFAAEVGACETELLAQEVGERDAHLRVRVSALAVDHDLDCLAHAAPPARARALVNARRAAT